ncbi:MAG: FHIPEP family type III secretion protein [Bacteroidota bacterium]
MDELKKEILEYIIKIPKDFTTGMINRLFEELGFNPNQLPSGDASTKDKLDRIIDTAHLHDCMPKFLRALISEMELNEGNSHRNKIESFILSWEKEFKAENSLQEESLAIPKDLSERLRELVRTSRTAIGSITSRVPIIIAIEEESDPIKEESLLKTERHLTLTLKAGQVDQLEKLGSCLFDDQASLYDLIDNGEDIWKILKRNHARLTKLIKSTKNSSNPQPVAWIGKIELLHRIYSSILLAKIGEKDGQADFMTLGYGNHYFYLLPKKGVKRAMRGRGDKQEVDIIEIDFHNTEAKDYGQASIITKASNAEVVITQSQEEMEGLKELLSFVNRQRTSLTRCIVDFGGQKPDPDSIETALKSIPFVCFGNASLGTRDVIRTIVKLFPRYASSLSPNCIIDQVRATLVEYAFENETITLLKHAISWSSWSYVGRPLFAKDFGEMIPAAYPHLMDLRSVASKDWYYNRSKDILDAYQADAFLKRDLEPEHKFHFYLTGAGGTGKSCFLRYVYENLVSRPDVLAIWYRVDAPSSEWSNVENRVKEEISKAFYHKTGESIDTYFKDDGEILREYLKNLIEKIQESHLKIKELIIFIDQLERTFESGDNPEARRLATISKEVILLLSKLKVGKGARIFIASRKQYLPDFLGSYLKASKNGLHFNVLQKITDPNEQSSFVAKILEWCINQELVDGSLTFDEEASKELGNRVGGHPLNMMLALIHMFSQGRKGDITKGIIEVQRPWENLFQLDIQLAAKDDIEWYFLLGMAHAGTEIVRFDEVWWRLRLVHPTLTARVNEVGPKGVLERLWLLGHLGRTIHPRPMGKNPEDRAKFLEFFHANLRDYLISDVLNYAGGEIQGSNRRGGMPSVWRALDRLTNAAHEWKQSLQPLPPEDIKELMVFRNTVIEKIQNDDKKTYADIFHLLFVRDAENARKALCEAAKECFVFSAVIHDEYGRWAFENVFPDGDKRVQCAKEWLPKCTLENRIRIFQYLIELNSSVSRAYLCDIISSDPNITIQEEAWQEIASILAEPLYAARYRSELVVSLAKAIYHKMKTGPAIPLQNRFGEFCTAACENNRIDLIRLMEDCEERIAVVDDFSPEKFSTLFHPERIDKWLDEADANVEVNPQLQSRELRGKIPPPIQLIAGAGLKDKVTGDVTQNWHSILRNQFGISFPTIHSITGELEENQIELRLNGQRVAIGEFYPEKVQTLKRHWGDIGLGAKTISAENEAFEESVLWVEKTDLDQIGWENESWTTEEAILSWIEKLFRKHFEEILDFESINRFLGEIAEDISVPQLLQSIGGNFQALRAILISIVQENLPLNERKVELMSELQEFLSQTDQVRIHPSIVVQKLREYIGEDICKNIIRTYNQSQLSVVLLDEKTENSLKEKLLRDNNGFQRLNIDPIQANKFASAMVRTFERIIREKNTIPVLVCDPALRIYLYRLLQKFDTRINVLSFTELSPEVPVNLEMVLPDNI